MVQPCWRQLWRQKMDVFMWWMEFWLRPPSNLCCPVDVTSQRLKSSWWVQRLMTWSIDPKCICAAYEAQCENKRHWAHGAHIVGSSHHATLLDSASIGWVNVFDQWGDFIPGTETRGHCEILPLHLWARPKTLKPFECVWDIWSTHVFFRVNVSRVQS